MRGESGWSHRPYLPPDRRGEAARPCICRVAPSRRGAQVEWFDRGASGGDASGGHILCWRRYAADAPFEEAPSDGPVARLDGLEEEQDYEVFVRRADGSARSRPRLLRTGFVPGDGVINYLHPLDDAYAFSGRALCSPSIARLPSGRLVASMDVFAPRAPQNLSLLFCSDDRGASWRYLCELFPCFWGTLFVHRGALYMLAHATEYGDVLIGASHDGGESWTPPTALFRGSGMYKAPGPHRAPMPVIEHRGRLFTALDFGCWAAGGHASGMLSADADADLLRPDSWTVSDAFLPYDPTWPGAAVGQAGGALEGNMVVDPDGRLLNMLRYQIGAAVPDSGLAIRLLADADRPEAPLAFHDIVRMEGGSNSKFQLRRDPVGGGYYALVSERPVGQPNNARNLLSLAVSDDLCSWRIAKRLLDYRHLPPADVGFQYCDFLFDGDDILFVCRTAFNRANNYHDANYSTFHRLRNFREL